MKKKDQLGQTLARITGRVIGTRGGAKVDQHLRARAGAHRLRDLASAPAARPEADPD